MALAVVLFGAPAQAQIPPNAAEIARYDGLHRAAWTGDAAAIGTLGGDANRRDGSGRTPLHVATFARRREAMAALVAIGADPRALEGQRYDAITIAAVMGDAELVRHAIALGGDPRAVTSPYDGTALIAAAHLGHAEVVRVLLAAGAVVDHVNNLGWTALIEAVILGDGGARHLACVEALLAAGADPGLADRRGFTPLDHARLRGFAGMVEALGAAARR